MHLNEYLEEPEVVVPVIRVKGAEGFLRSKSKSMSRPKFDEQIQTTFSRDESEKDNAHSEVSSEKESMPPIKEQTKEVSAIPLDQILKDPEPSLLEEEQIKESDTPQINQIESEQIEVTFDNKPQASLVEECTVQKESDLPEPEPEVIMVEMEDQKQVEKPETSIAFNVNSDINTSSVEMDHKEDHSNIHNENNSLLLNQFQETSMYDKEEHKDLTTNEVSVTQQPFPMKIRNWKKRKPGVYNNKTKPHLMLKN